MATTVRHMTNIITHTAGLYGSTGTEDMGDSQTGRARWDDVIPESEAAEFYPWNEDKIFSTDDFKDFMLLDFYLIILFIRDNNWGREGQFWPWPETLS